MFSLFQSNKLPVSEPEMKWMEEKFIEFSEAFGSDFQKGRGFLLPVKEQFPYDDLRDPVQLNALLKQVAELLFIDAGTVNVETFDTYDPLHGAPMMRANKITGMANHEISDREGKAHCTIGIAETALRDATKTVYLLVERLSHFRMYGSKIDFRGLLSNRLADLAVVFFGFGVFLENIRFVKTAAGKQALGSIPLDQIATSAALYARLSGCDASKAILLFHPNSAKLFANAAKAFEKNGLFLIDEKNWKTPVKRQEAFPVKEVTTSLIDLKAKHLEELQKISPHNLADLHNLSYYRLQQGKYEEAIEGFDKCIAGKNTLAFAYNNRGYCKLMLNRLEEGHDDIEKSLSLRDDNSFAWRNLGVYYLKANQPQEALGLFEKAFAMNPKTELIHFYTGSALFALGEKEKARNAFEHSRQIPELPAPDYPELS